MPKINKTEFRIESLNIFNPKKKLVGGAPLHVKRAKTPLSTSFFLGLKCFISYIRFFKDKNLFKVIILAFTSTSKIKGTSSLSQLESRAVLYYEIHILTL